MKMPNHYFQFKQFTVQQDKSALKVCTDACLFGAWTAEKIQHSTSGIQRILDIGTGTGLLALMLAQKTAAVIEGVEIDEDSAIQAGENFADSPWKERLTIHHQPVQQFAALSRKKFDFIISNPPFFENDLRSDKAHKNISKHDESLRLEDLINCMIKLLKDEGSFAVLLPYHRTDYFTGLCETKGFHIIDKTLVKQSPRHDHFRTMILAGRKKEETRTTSICISNEENNYTEEFTRLLKDYYLYL